MDDDAFLNERRQALRESIDYFSNDNKPERERWVCKLLLNSLRVPFHEAEVVSSLSEPPDVVFRDAQFEIKEIQAPGRKRHLEFKQALAHALTASTPGELIEEFAPVHITPKGIADLVLAKLDELAVKYPLAIRQSTDLLIYVNLQDCYLQQGPVPSSELFSSSGWRSVSAAENQAAIVYFAGVAAPSFLRAVQSTVQTGSV